MNTKISGKILSKILGVFVLLVFSLLLIISPYVVFYPGEVDTYMLSTINRIHIFFSNFLLAAGITFLRISYKRYLKLNTGPVSESFKPILKVIDPFILGLCFLWWVSTLFSIWPGSIWIITTVKIIVGLVLWISIYTLYQNKTSIERILGIHKDVGGHGH